MRPFQREHNATIYPVRGDVDVTLIPGHTEIMTRGLRQKWNPDVTRDVLLVIFTQVPVTIVKGKHPGCGRADLLTIVLCLKNSRQLDETAHIACEPLLVDSRISEIQSEPPEA